MTKIQKKYQIPNFPDYYVTETGEIWSHKSNAPKRLTPKNCRGYHYFSLNGKTISLNRIIKITLFNCLSKSREITINHKDGSKLNNNLSNLEIISHKENIAHFWKHGTRETYKGEKSHLAKLTDEGVLDIRALKSAGYRVADIAKKYGVGLQAIYKILEGKTWKHIK